MRSVMVHQFSQVPRADIPRSSFNRSHGHKTTFDSGYLIPVFTDEALPGDTFNCNMTVFARLSTPLHPVMDNLFMDCFFFFVPLRLVWTNFPKFFGEQDNPSDSVSYLVPTVSGNWTNGSLSDYFGIPTGIPVVCSSLFHRSYNLIWNQWFRDENLQNSRPVSKGDGPDASTDYILMRRGKRHDYFTSALPWPQKGPAVTLPLGSQAVVKTSGSALVSGGQVQMLFKENVAGGAVTSGPMGVASGGAGYTVGTAPTVGIYPSNLYADLSTATAATINQLRQAFQIQRMYERDARGGTRYTEIIQAHFGVTSPDARLQRAEYLGGGSVPITVSPIAQTSNTTAAPTPLGSLGAIGTSAMHGVGFTKSFTEHGIIIGLVSVRADINYQQGLNRMFSRSTRFDFYWPALAHLGEQAISRKEIYMEGNANDDIVFGYQERYAEYRYKPSIITGQFRSNFAQTLDSWHLAQNFSAPPTLSGAFIEDNPPVSRVVAVPTQPQFLFDSYFKLHCARPMPLYGVPGNIDRF